MHNRDLWKETEKGKKVTATLSSTTTTAATTITIIPAAATA
jgi:hypothetical protein